MSTDSKLQVDDAPVGKPTFMEKLRNIGPGAVISAFFVGPGTITSMTIAGASYKYTLLWTLVFTGIMALILYEKCIRIGMIGNVTLQSAVRDYFPNPVIRWPVIILAMLAVSVGSLAWVIGNLTGAVLALQFFIPAHQAILAIVIGILALTLLMLGSYRVFERVMVVLVLILTACFAITAIAIKPSLGSILQGALIPSIPAGSSSLVLGMVGTTLGGSMLFLYSSTVKERWGGQPKKMEFAKFDLYFSVPLGILISALIVVTGAGMFGTAITFTYGATELAAQLEPVLGGAAYYIFGLGLFAASISSAVPTTVACAFVISGLLGWEEDLKAPKFKAIEIVFLAIVVFFTAIGQRPLQLILAAQTLNGLLLPVSAILVVLVVGRKSIVGKFKASTFENIVMGAIIIAVLYLGYMQFIGA